MNADTENQENGSPPAFIPNSKVEKRFDPLKRQVFITSATFMCSLNCGMIAGYSAILIPQLNEPNSKFKFTESDTSWIASAATLAMTPACFSAGILMELYGRKFVNLALNIPFVVGWILIYSARGLSMFLIGRLIQGIALGLSGPVNSVYIGETTEPKYRGIFLGSISLGYTIGILIVHLMGTFLPWRNTALICGISNIYNIIVYLIAPESPSYLLAKGKIEQAYVAFTWCRGYDEQSLEEFNTVVQNQKLKEQEKATSALSNFRLPEFYKPLLILTLMFFVLQFVGVNVIAFYTVEILQKTVDDIVNPYLAMFVIDVARVIVTLLACIMLKRMHRRILCFISGYGTAIAMLSLAVSIYLIHKIPNVPWLPMFLILAYVCFSSFGLMLLPWCLVGELFPLKSRGLGSGISSSINFVFFFSVVKMAPSLFKTIDMHGAFLCYGSVALIGTTLLVICLPETKDKTLQEIEDGFAKKGNDPKVKAARDSIQG